MVNRFDAFVLEALKSWAGHSYIIDSAVAFLASSELLKGAVFISVLWWYWFRGGDAAVVRRTREHLSCTLIAGIVAIVVARALALLLPFRVRPRFESSLDFSTAKNVGTYFVDWSSFPSDHAVLFAALAVGFGFVSLRLGVLAFIYMLIVIVFPRMYLGYHYPTDILVGLAIGIVIGYGFNTTRFRRWLAGPIMQWEQHAPSSFYVMMFIVSFQVATMFTSLRTIALGAVHFAERVLK